MLKIVNTVERLINRLIKSISRLLRELDNNKETINNPITMSN